MIAPRAPWRASPVRWVGFVRPCEPTLVDRPPAGAGWLHEVKHDGFRILVRKLGERAKVWSRRGADFTDRFLGIAEAVRGLAVDRALKRPRRRRIFSATHGAERSGPPSVSAGRKRAAWSNDKVRRRRHVVMPKIELRH